MRYAPLTQDFDSISNEAQSQYSPGLNDFDNLNGSSIQTPSVSGLFGSLSVPQQQASQDLQSVTPNAPLSWNLINPMGTMSPFSGSSNSGLSSISNFLNTPHPGLAKAALGTALAVPAEMAAAPALAAAGIGEGLMTGGAFLNRALSGAAGGAAGALPNSLSVNQDGTLNLSMANEGLGASLGGSLSGVLGGMQPGWFAKMTGGTATPEQVAAIQAAQPKGVSLPAGNVINSPGMQSFYTKLGMLPFSNTGKPFNQLNGFFSNTINDLAGPSSGISGDVLDSTAYNDMKNNYESAKQNTSSLYNNYNTAAQNLGDIDFNTNAFDTAVSNAKNEIQNNIPLTSDGTPNASIQKQYSGILNFLNDYQNTPVSNFNTAMSLDKGLTNEMGTLSDDPVSMRYLQSVKGGLAQSMDDTAQQYPSISGLYNQAKQARVDQGLFESNPNGTMTQFFKNYKNPAINTSNNFISKSLPSINPTSNNPDQISYFMNNLSPEGQNAVRASFLSPPSNQSANSISYQTSQLQKLSGPEQEAMFGDQEPQVSQLQTLANMYPKGKYPGYTPETGFNIGKLLVLNPKMWPLLPAAPLIRSALTSKWLPNAYVNSLGAPSLLSNLIGPTAASMAGPLARQGVIQSATSGANQQ